MAHVTERFKSMGEGFPELRKDRPNGDSYAGVGVYTKAGDVMLLLADTHVEYNEDGQVILYVWDESTAIEGEPSHRIVLIRDVSRAVERALEED